MDAGWDLSESDQIEKAFELQRQVRPSLLIGSPECAPFSQLMAFRSGECLGYPGTGTQFARRSAARLALVRRQRSWSMMMCTRFLSEKHLRRHLANFLLTLPRRMKSTTLIFGGLRPRKHQM